jgi:hypothetical protein
MNKKNTKTNYNNHIISLIETAVKVKWCMLNNTKVSNAEKNAITNDILRLMRCLYITTKYADNNIVLDDTFEMILEEKCRQGRLQGWYDPNIELPFGGIEAFATPPPPPPPPKKRLFETIATPVVESSSNKLLGKRKQLPLPSFNEFVTNYKIPLTEPSPTPNKKQRLELKTERSIKMATITTKTTTTKVCLEAYSQDLKSRFVNSFEQTKLEYYDEQNNLLIVTTRFSYFRLMTSINPVISIPRLF